MIKKNGRSGKLTASVEVEPQPATDVGQESAGPIRRPGGICQGPPLGRRPMPRFVVSGTLGLIVQAAVFGYDGAMELTFIKHIESKPRVCGGKPCVAGTRIRVQDIYVWHELQGKTPDEIVSDFPQLTLADVHAALAYYWDNREAIQRQ